MFGVSPSYFVSRFGDGFTCAEVATALGDLRAHGFEAFQTEVVHPDGLAAWRTGGAAEIAAAARAAGLAVSQFVGHFLLHAFVSPAALASDLGPGGTAEALEGLEHFPACEVFTVPLPPFRPTEPADLTATAIAGFRARLAEKVSAMLDLVERSGRGMALELMPGNLLGGVEGFLRLHAELGRPALGYNFDTGHAWSTKAWVPLIPAAVGPQLFGTHLKDNAQDDTARAPGAGTIPWRETLTALRVTGYAGSLDLEFRSPPETTDRDYRDALRFVKALAH